MKSRLGLFLLFLFLCKPQISAPQDHAPTIPDDGKIHLDVVVTPKSGPPVSGLAQQDFTIFDNKSPRAIISFQAIDGRQAPIEVVLLIDAVNIGAQNVALQRQEIDKFLKAEGGHLAYPTSLAVLNDTGTQIQEGSSKDGNAISAALDQDSIALRSLGRSAGFYGATERLQISLQGLQQLAARESAKPGRKIILWVSPG